MSLVSLSGVGCLQEGGGCSVAVASLSLCAAVSKQVSAQTVLRGNVCSLHLAVLLSTCGSRATC